MFITLETCHRPPARRANSLVIKSLGNTTSVTPGGTHGVDDGQNAGSELVGFSDLNRAAGGGGIARVVGIAQLRGLHVPRCEC